MQGIETQSGSLGDRSAECQETLPVMQGIETTTTRAGAIRAMMGQETLPVMQGIETPRKARAHLPRRGSQETLPVMQGIETARWPWRRGPCGGVRKPSP